MLRRLARDWQMRLAMLFVGGIMLLLSVIGIIRFMDVVVVTGYEYVDTLIFGILATIGLLGLCCLVGSFVLEIEDSEDRIDDR